MELHVVSRGDQSWLEGEPGTRMLTTPNDVVDIIGVCGEHGVRKVLLYAENLTEQFFDLSSQEAGAVLQKLRNYHIRAAVVAPSSTTHMSTMFREMAKEENKGSDIRFFEDKAAAEDWLARA